MQVGLKFLTEKNIPKAAIWNQATSSIEIGKIIGVDKMLNFFPADWDSAEQCFPLFINVKTEDDSGARGLILERSTGNGDVYFHTVRVIKHHMALKWQKSRQKYK